MPKNSVGRFHAAKIQGGLKDEDGNDCQIIYEVTLKYLVSAVGPCNKSELAALVADRIEAGGGVAKIDIDKVVIVSVERS